MSPISVTARWRWLLATSMLCSFVRAQVGHSSLPCSQGEPDYSCTGDLSRLPAVCTRNGPSLQLGRFPYEPALVGKSHKETICDKFGGSSELAIYKWGLVVRKDLTTTFGHPFVCTEDIAVPYRKADKPPMMYVRRAATTAYFKRTLSAGEYQRASKTAAWPCHKVPVRTLRVWGRRRGLFVKLTNGAIRSALFVRANRDCSIPSSAFPLYKQNYTRKEMLGRLTRDRIATFVINYLRILAYSNFFCS